MAQENDNGQPQPSQESTMDHDITFPNIGEETGESGDGSSLEERLAAIEAKREEDRQAFDEERRQWQGTIDRLLQGQQAQQPQQQQDTQSRQEAPPGVDFKDLPDPVDKPDEFKAALGERFNRALNTSIQQTQQRMSQQQMSQQQRQQALDNMWNRFQNEYSDLAPKETLLRGAVQAEQTALRQKNLDPNQAMFADPDSFMKNVASRMRKDLGQDGDHNTQPAAPASSPGQQNGQQQANRTGGIAGGSNPLSKGGQQKKEPPGFIEQLKKQQMDSGLL